MPAWVEAWVKVEGGAVVEALVQEEAAARELEADQVVAVVRVREEGVRDSEDLHSYHGRGRHAGGYLPALRAGSHIYYD
jgi:hypothetical protein